MATQNKFPLGWDEKRVQQSNITIDSQKMKR
jgi:hypothetical protein